MVIDIFPIKQESDKILSNLVNDFGIPTVWKDLAIYYLLGKENDEIHFRFRNKKCQLFYIKPQTDEEFRPKIYINTDRTSLRSMFKFLQQKGSFLGTHDGHLYWEFYPSWER